MSPTARHRLLGAANDRLNPVLVKEVRQALRGRFFRFTFAFTAAAATVVGLCVLVFVGGRPSVPVGPPFFLAIFGCLAAAVHGFVPFSAFLSMGSEWDENTYDLLVLSNLRPRHIVLGKLLAALAQAGLHYATFGPFLVFAFLLRGVDLATIAVLLAGLVVLSATLTLEAIALSSVTRIRFLRIVGMAGLGAGLVAVTVASISAASLLVFTAFVVHGPRFSAVFVAMLAGLVALGALAFAIACSRLSHPEENRSTALRILTIVLLLGFLGCAAFFYARTPSPSGLSSVATVGIFGLLVPSLFFATEPERLGRRVRPRVPSSRIGALLVSPFLPGGGRGLLLFLVQAAIVLLGAAAIRAFGPTPTLFPLPSGEGAPFIALVYGFVCLALPSGLFYRATARPKGRILAALAIPIAFFGSIFLPVLFAFLVSGPRAVTLRHAGNPFHLVDRAFTAGGSAETMEAMAWASVLAGAALLLNAPRLLRAFREVLAASEDRRESERARAAALHAPAAVEGASPHAVPER